jgi:hypothetical protein
LLQNGPDAIFGQELQTGGWLSFLGSMERLAFFSVFMHWLWIIAAVTLGVTFRSLPTFQPRRVPSQLAKFG